MKCWPPNNRPLRWPRERDMSSRSSSGPSSMILVGYPVFFYLEMMILQVTWLGWREVWRIWSTVDLCSELVIITWVLWWREHIFTTLSGAWQGRRAVPREPRLSKRYLQGLFFIWDLMKLFIDVTQFVRGHVQVTSLLL